MCIAYWTFLSDRMRLVELSEIFERSSIDLNLQLSACSATFQKTVVKHCYSAAVGSRRRFATEVGLAVEHLEAESERTRDSHHG